MIVNISGSVRKEYSVMFQKDYLNNYGIEITKKSKRGQAIFSYFNDASAAIEQLHGQESNQYLRSSKSGCVYLCPNEAIIGKSHCYYAWPKRIRMTVASRKRKSFELGALGETRNHLAAAEIFTNNLSICVPQLFAMRSLSQYGIIIEQTLFFDYVAKGQTFFDYLLEVGSNDVPEWLIFGLKNALNIMARQGVLHLDFRAENIIVDVENKKIYLLDWEYALIQKNINQQQFFNFGMGYFCHMLGIRSETEASEINKFIDFMGAVLGEALHNSDTFNIVRNHGYGKKRASEFLLAL